MIEINEDNQNNNLLNDILSPEKLPFSEYQDLEVSQPIKVAEALKDVMIEKNISVDVISEFYIKFYYNQSSTKRGEYIMDRRRFNIFITSLSISIGVDPFEAKYFKFVDEVKKLIIGEKSIKNERWQKWF